MNRQPRTQRLRSSPRPEVEGWTGCSMCAPTDNVSHRASFPSLSPIPLPIPLPSPSPLPTLAGPRKSGRARVSPSRGLVLSYVHYFPLLPRRVGNSYMIYIIMYLNLPIISIYILLLYYNIPTHPYTSPYTPKHHHTPLYNTIHPIHHLMYSTIIIGMFRYIIIIIYEVPTPEAAWVCVNTLLPSTFQGKTLVKCFST